MTDKKSLVPKRRFKEFKNTHAWKQRKFGELADIVRGASPRPIQDPKWFDDESDIGWLRIADVTEQDGRIHFLKQRISKAGQEKTRVLTETHLLLSIAATVGKPVVNHVKTGVHDGFLIFQNPKFNREFMFQWLEMFRPKWQKYGQPGSQVNLNSDLVKNQEIMLPSEEEQKKIGEFFYQLDNLISLQQRKLEKMKALKSAYLSEMFPAEGELEPKRRFAGFTQAWKQRKLKTVFKDFIVPMRDKPKEFSGTVPWTRIEDIEGRFINGTTSGQFVSEETIKSMNLKVIPKGSLIVSASATFGVVAIVNNDLITNQTFIGLVPNTNYNIDFLYAFFKSTSIQRKMKRESAGSTIFYISREQFENMIGEFPILEEQEKIGKLFKQLDDTIALHQRKLEKLQNIKKAYLMEMFV
ncbi:restriction endonuclease subunit S [Bacillus timonensis]|uniref:restriction endonuclease subunit S n=1 Tax=Bacillus timonensis TaxID=1033734 RepID=UPI00028912D6|nr:restriction endonuclease subunit S [Bacillus timonensis]